MPRIWAETIDSHRQHVNDAILDATAALIAERGPLSIAMSAIAERAGIGRATLYKYFPDVQSILVAWHARDFADQRDRLTALSEDDRVSLQDVAELIGAQRRDHRTNGDVLGVLAHTLAGAEGVPEGAIEHEIVATLTAVLTRLVERRQVRDDEQPELLARWLLHAAHAPGDLDDAAVSKLVVDSLAARPGRRRR